MAENAVKESFKRNRTTHWETIHSVNRKETGWYYHRWMRKVYRFAIPPGQRVLELGCGKGDLLAALEPTYGLGIDFSPSAIASARSRHPHLHFQLMDAESLEIDTAPFDFIILSDLVNDVWDVQELFTGLQAYCHDSTRIVMNCYSHLWQSPMQLARKAGLANPLLLQNWLTVPDIRNLFALSGFEVLKH